jgi:hypothetical protein
MADRLFIRIKYLLYGLVRGQVCTVMALVTTMAIEVHRFDRDPHLAVMANAQKVADLHVGHFPYWSKLWSRLRNNQLLMIGSRSASRAEGYDGERTKYLGSLGRMLIRFCNNDVLNAIDGVILAMFHALEK